ncbi:nucleotidyltransferase domain-containing protein [Limosilactobacillus equigenerosi]|uniref:nucleotidyltransferase domain-containing protein n=1 Tax=Limosilactobacillus equigenerosi TaxID=417373 RepID=UPI0006CF8912|nr:nucleotidyltransferase [Limosilactobacillus equigenerosi]
MNDTNLVLQILVNNISLSDTAKERIAKEYEALAKLFDASDLDVDIKYQGSYALGTSIRPLNHDDDYDIDLVCILNNGLNNKPEEIKHSVGDVLLNSERYKDKVEENRRSWTVEYFNSHVDVLPSILDPDNNSDLLITDNKNGYNLINSSPFKFRDWFIRMSNYVPKKC